MGFFSGLFGGGADDDGKDLEPEEVDTGTDDEPAQEQGNDGEDSADSGSASSGSDR